MEKETELYLIEQIRKLENALEISKFDCVKLQHENRELAKKQADIGKAMGFDFIQDKLGLSVCYYPEKKECYISSYKYQIKVPIDNETFNVLYKLLNEPSK